MRRANITQIALARAEAGLTQSELARRVRASARTVSRIERGESRPRLPLAVRLAKELDLDLETVLNDRGAA
jgi:DNA-binding XRE family transcriptional regulator